MNLPTRCIAASEWAELRRLHESRVDRWIGPHLQRRSGGRSHPVEDFLFTYYSYRPSALRRWHPGIGVTLTGSGVEAFRAVKGYDVRDGRAQVPPSLAGERFEQIGQIRDLLAATGARPLHLSCFGLHEWAMVYQQSSAELRHGGYPLRLGSAGTDEVVQSHRLLCTHHDAVRFFTPAARRRNAVQPTRESQSRLEQPGCLHATMDCYKWAYKLAPFTPADLVADCFELAREVRLVDMRASPYDLRSLGVEPLCIEVPTGKAEYVAFQRRFAARAADLRERLIEVCDLALAQVCGTRTEVGDTAAAEG